MPFGNFYQNMSLPQELTSSTFVDFWLSNWTRHFPSYPVYHDEISLLVLQQVLCSKNSPGTSYNVCGNYPLKPCTVKMDFSFTKHVSHVYWRQNKVNGHKCKLLSSFLKGDKESQLDLFNLIHGAKCPSQIESTLKGKKDNAPRGKYSQILCFLLSLLHVCPLSIHHFQFIQEQPLR